MMCLISIITSYMNTWIKELQLMNVNFEVDLKKIANYFKRVNINITEFGKSKMLKRVPFPVENLNRSPTLGDIKKD